MLPLKDDIPTDRVPVVTLLLIAAGVVAQLLADGAGLLPLLAGALFLWLFGTSVEDATSRPRFLVLCLLGAAAAVALGRALDAGAADATLAAAGVASTAIGGHVRLYPRARIVTLLLVPTAFTLHELPTWAFAAAWLVVQAAFALTGVTGPLGDGGAGSFAATLAPSALGVLAVPPLARRRKQLERARSTTPAWS